MAKLKLIPGNTYTLEQFESALRTAKTGKKKFLKDNEEGFYSYSEERYVEAEEVAKLLETIGKYNDNESVYRYFNNCFMPTDIAINQVGETRTKEVTSSNIYDKMCAPSEADFEGVFKVIWKWREEPITVVRVWTKNTTLSQSDVRAFM